MRCSWQWISIQCCRYLKDLRTPKAERDSITSFHYRENVRRLRQYTLSVTTMLMNWKEHRYLRKIKVLNDHEVLLQGYDREYEAETVAIHDIGFIARCVQLIVELG